MTTTKKRKTVKKSKKKGTTAKRRSTTKKSLNVGTITITNTPATNPPTTAGTDDFNYASGE